MIKETPAKKPIYKRWWFWVLAVFFGLAFIGSLIPESEEDKALAAAEKAKADEMAAAEAKKKAAERDQGLHCLSPWDGSSSQLVAMVKPQMRNPKSFEHIETRIGPKDKNGQHKVAMKYRAENGFGGMTIGYVSGKVSNADCSVTSIDSSN